MTTTNESNEAYERRMAAGKLLVEAPQGAQFQRKGINRPWDVWENIPPEHVLTSLVGCVVRIAPTPKKVLRPWAEIWEIEQRREDATFLTLGLVGLAKEKLDDLAGTPADELEENGFPDAWFTPEEPKR